MRVTAAGVFVMPHSTFQNLDYAKLCDGLGLKPSKPDHNAAGEYVGPAQSAETASATA